MTNTVNEERYLELLRMVYTEGQDEEDRTGVGTRTIFGTQVRYDLRNGFPILTTRKLRLDTGLSEMLWIIEGSSDERRLAELRYQKPREEIVSKTTVWTQNAQAPYWTERHLQAHSGDLGRVYGQQVRDWRGIDQNGNVVSIDQLAGLISEIKNNPRSRRLLVNMWNPAELDQMALPPCHLLWDFYVSPDGHLDLLLLQRSCDLVLGAPANLVEYGVLISMIAQVCGLTPRYLIHSIGSAHIYSNHFDLVEEQLTRTPFAAPNLVINTEVHDIHGFTMKDFYLEDYQAHPAMTAPMAV